MADFGAVYVHILGIKGQCKQVEEKINRISYSLCIASTMNIFRGSSAVNSSGNR